MTWTISQNIAERSINITSILNKSVIKQVYEKEENRKFNKKIDQHI